MVYRLIKLNIRHCQQSATWSQDVPGFFWVLTTLPPVPESLQWPGCSASVCSNEEGGIHGLQNSRIFGAFHEEWMIIYAFNSRGFPLRKWMSRSSVLKLMVCGHKSPRFPASQQWPPPPPPPPRPRPRPRPPLPPAIATTTATATTTTTTQPHNHTTTQPQPQPQQQQLPKKRKQQRDIKTAFWASRHHILGRS